MPEQRVPQDLPDSLELVEMMGRKDNQDPPVSLASLEPMEMLD